MKAIPFFLFTMLALVACQDQPNTDQLTEELKTTVSDTKATTGDFDSQAQLESMNARYILLDADLKTTAETMKYAQLSAEGETKSALGVKLKELEALEERMQLWGDTYNQMIPQPCNHDHDHGEHEPHFHAPELDLSNLPQDEQKAILGGLLDELKNVRKEMETTAAQ